MQQSTAPSGSRYFHRFVAPSVPARPPMLLLHRTGGDENDLIEAARRVAPGSALLAIRGNVLEDGKPRFFRRVARGQFDLEDLKRRTDELAEFIAWARDAYDLAAPIAFGFSNGANIAWSLVLRHPRSLGAAVLMRPYFAYDPRPVGELNGISVLVIAGRLDTTVVPERANELPQLLSEAGARVSLKWIEAGHDFSIDDEKLASEWIKHLE
jgi:phospholipase/carboxylesterase